MSWLANRRRGVGKKENKITITVRDKSFIRANETYGTSNDWKVIIIVFEFPILVNTLNCSGGTTSSSAAVVVKNDNGDIINASALSKNPITLSINGLVKEIYLSSKNNGGYCIVDGKRIWN